MNITPVYSLFLIASILQDFLNLFDRFGFKKYSYVKPNVLSTYQTTTFIAESVLLRKLSSYHSGIIAVITFPQVTLQNIRCALKEVLLASIVVSVPFKH